MAARRARDEGDTRKGAGEEGGKEEALRDGREKNEGDKRKGRARRRTRVPTGANFEGTPASRRLYPS